MRFAVLGAAFLLLPVSAGATGSADAGALYKERCGSCHTERRLVSRLKAWPENGRAARLDKLLASHHAPDAAERAALVAFLDAVARR
jgi:mono/diheme cytochrome c family protein